MQTVPEMKQGEIANFDDITEPLYKFIKDGKDYVLKASASGNAVSKYKNAQARAVKIQDGKPQSFDGLSDVEFLLVSLCVFEIKDDKELSVTTDTVKKWSYNIQKHLINKIYVHSPINEFYQPSAEDLRSQIEMLQARLELLEAGGPVEAAKKPLTDMKDG